MEIGIWENVEKTNKTARDNHRLYYAKCKFCGKERVATLSNLKQAKTCKHIKTEIKNKRLSSIFLNMKRRCYNKEEKSFRFYGAKGIKICDEWIKNPKLFEDWSLKNGYKPNLTIDRIYSDKDYCPENCRWITKEDNARYKSTTIVISAAGMSKSGKEWADFLGVGTNTINNYRRKYGYENTVEFIRRALKNGVPKLEYGESYYEKLMLN